VTGGVSCVMFYAELIRNHGGIETAVFRRNCT